MVKIGGSIEPAKPIAKPSPPPIPTRVIVSEDAEVIVEEKKQKPRRVEKPVPANAIAWLVDSTKVRYAHHLPRCKIPGCTADPKAWKFVSERSVTCENNHLTAWNASPTWRYLLEIEAWLRDKS